MSVPSTDETRAVVVTGAARGIGRAVVARLAARGFRVAALDRESVGSSDASELVTFFEVDITAFSALPSIAERVERDLGPVYALVNNAGVFERTPALSYSDEALRRTLAVNLEGALACTRAFGRAMSERRSGRIVNVASIAAEAGAALAAAYAASKAGLVAVTQSHARELGPLGIAVNAVLPGYCETPMLEPDRALVSKFVSPRIPLKRFVTPDEVAEVVEMLVCLQTPYLTGAAIPIDGGLHVG